MYIGTRPTVTIRDVAAMTDPYATLGITPDATPDEIRTAYRRASLAAHPDRGGTDETMAAVNAAYATLTDPAYLDPAETMIRSLLAETVRADHVVWPAEHMREQVEEAIAAIERKLVWVLCEISRLPQLLGRLSAPEWDETVQQQLQEQEDNRVGMKQHLELLRTVRSRLDRYVDRD
jgi:hypothetical protein